MWGYCPCTFSNLVGDYFSPKCLQQTFRQLFGVTLDFFYQVFTLSKQSSIIDPSLLY